MKLIYLDQLHWIEIAKYINGKKVKEGTEEALEHMQKLSIEDNAIFPISISHYFETLKQSDSGRRQRLADVMRGMSKGYTVAGLNKIVQYEARSAIAKIFDLDSVNELKKFTYIGRDFEHALGRSFNFEVEWPVSISISEQQKQSFQTDVMNILEDMFLSGTLKVNGNSYPFITPDLSADNIFKDHLEEWKGCASNMSPDELKNKIYAITFNDVIEKICEAFSFFGIDSDELLKLGEKGICRLLDLMPTRVADMHLRDQWARNGNLKPKQSDLNDWCSIGAAVCYADFVITENQMNNLLSRSAIYKGKLSSELSSILCF